MQHTYVGTEHLLLGLIKEGDGVAAQVIQSFNVDFDTIRDEMGQQQAKAFLGAVAPAIQSALETLKQTRETLSSGVRGLTGEEQPEEMLGAETPDMGADDMAGAADTDAMNPELGDETDADADAAALDDFAAAEPAAGGPDEAGRAKRESINRSNSLLKVLAG